MTTATQAVKGYARPLPNVDDDSREQWTGFRNRRFLLFQCQTCHAWYWPKAFCRNHDNEPFFGNLAWTEASGKGVVFAFNVHRWAMEPSFNDAVPYVYALIELDEGPMFGSNIVGCDPSDVRVGMRVEVVYEDIEAGFTLPKFRPVEPIGDAPLTAPR